MVNYILQITKVVCVVYFMEHLPTFRVILHGGPHKYDQVKLVKGNDVRSSLLEKPSQMRENLKVREGLRVIE